MVAGAGVWLRLSPYSLPAEGATSERERGGGEREEGKRREGGKRGSPGEGISGKAGGGGGHPGSAPAKLGSHARRLCLYTVRSRPPAGSPLAHASLFSESEAPQLRRREPSAPSAGPPARVTRSRRGSPRPAPPRPPRLGRDPPAAEAEPPAAPPSSPTFLRRSAAERGRKIPLCGHHSFSSSSRICLR